MEFYTNKDYEEMKKLKKDFEEEGRNFTVGDIQKRLRFGEKRATVLYNDLTKGTKER